jgi:hypothetical protein
MFFKNRILKLLNFYTRWSCSACAWSWAVATTWLISDNMLCWYYCSECNNSCSNFNCFVSRLNTTAISRIFTSCLLIGQNLKWDKVKDTLRFNRLKILTLAKTIVANKAKANVNSIAFISQSKKKLILTV